MLTPEKTKSLVELLCSDATLSEQGIREITDVLLKSPDVDTQDAKKLMSVLATADRHKREAIILLMAKFPLPEISANLLRLCKQKKGVCLHILAQLLLKLLVSMRIAIWKTSSMKWQTKFCTSCKDVADVRTPW